MTNVQPPHIENATINPAPPDQSGLAWRPVSRLDLAALAELAGICQLADGGLTFMNDPEYLEGRYFPDAPGAAIGAFDSDGRLAACAAVYTGGDATAQRATITGQVRPDLRGRGIGTYLMRWSQAQAQALLSGVAAERRVLRVATEALTEPANRLYLAHGFERVFEELAMGRDLRHPLPERTLPPGVTITTWQLGVAEEFFQA